MLSCSYYGSALSDPVITEYLAVMHDGYAGQKALQDLYMVAQSAQASLSESLSSSNLDRIADSMNGGTPPALIKFKKDGKYHRVIHRQWSQS